MKTNTVYEQVNERIISLLEKGVAPWRQPWKSKGIKPAMNFISKKRYAGCNFFLLNSLGYSCPFWATFKQIQSKGGKVKKGEKGTIIVFWKLFSIKEKNENGELKDKNIPLLKTSYVFNLEQCEGIEFDTEEIQLLEHNSIEDCEKIRSKFPLGMPEIKHEKDRAFYSPSLDYINLPKIGLYENAEEYYQTLFHESIHATGHKSRLNRQTLTDVHYFGDENYSQEELVAEMGASYLAAFSNIDDSTIENSASYLSNWLAAIRKDTKILIKAASEAQKAVNYLIGKEWQEVEEETE